jgi:hypothetical protein
MMVVILMTVMVVVRVAVGVVVRRFVWGFVHGGPAARIARCHFSAKARALPLK